MKLGHGDMIQFCRYAAELKAMGAGSISIICHLVLKALFASLEAVDAVFHFDEQIPANLPYLQAPHGHIAKWAPFLQIGAGWRIEWILLGAV